MAEAPTSLTTPLDVKVSEQQLATLLREAPTTVPSLLIVREIQPGESGATLHFQQGNYGHLALNDPNYATYLRMARQSQERQHPLGVAFGEDAAILRLIRADNDVPGQLADESPGRTRVLFQGHDGT